MSEMPDRDTAHRPLVTLAEAAAYLDLPAESVRALAGAGYLDPSDQGPDGPLFRLGDVKAFLARNADNGAGQLSPLTEGSADPQALLDALGGRCEEMARRALEIFTTAFPDARGWSLAEQARFVAQARGRFEAILAVTSQGVEVDQVLVDDLQEVGAAAAWEGSPLPQLLVVLRISRDLVVQTAIELADEAGRPGGLALSLLLTRVLPAMDRLTDALAQGYWAAILRGQEEAKARYEHVVENSSDGVYEVDPEGRVRYANPSLALVLGVPLDHLEGARLADALTPLGGGPSLEALTRGPADGASLVELGIVRHDGVRRVLQVRTLPRFAHGELLGFQGVVRDVTAASDLEADKNEFLAMVTHDLRAPLTAILGLGATLETHSGELSGERVRRMGASIRGHAERISRLADDLADMSRLEANALLLTPRPVDLAQVVGAAVAATEAAPGDVEIRMPVTGLPVMADPRRLEQVVANLVENALVHGAAPVVVEAAETGEGVEVSVVDAGPGVPDSLVHALFSRLGPQGPGGERFGTGIGLFLVRGLVEAMGGRVAYERGPGGMGSAFRVRLTRPPRR